MKAVKGIIAGLLFLLPLLWFIHDDGLAFRQHGGNWLPFVWAFVVPPIFAILIAGVIGNFLSFNDRNGKPVFNRFWAIAIFMWLVMVGIAFLLKGDA